jgi:putative transposase
MGSPYANFTIGGIVEAPRLSCRLPTPLTNAIESLNAKLRRSVRSRGHFPSDEAATKLIWLQLREITQKWKMPPREWAAAKAQFAVVFGDRFEVNR